MMMVYWSVYAPTASYTHRFIFRPIIFTFMLCSRRKNYAHNVCVCVPCAVWYAVATNNDAYTFFLVRSFLCVPARQHYNRANVEQREIVVISNAKHEPMRTEIQKVNILGSFDRHRLSFYFFSAINLINKFISIQMISHSN